ncbi:unnamed protein product, partial [Discosporangium mesarthrocarpum]
RYLSNTVRLVGIGPTDIVDGNVTLTLGMIWSLIVFFMSQDLGDQGEGLASLKERILAWVRKRTKNHPDVVVTNFTESFADGRAFLAMLNDCEPEGCPYKPSDVPAENLRRAFSDFTRLYDVGSILDPDDPQCCSDEKANLTYLAELMKAMPEPRGPSLSSSVGSEALLAPPPGPRSPEEARTAALKAAEDGLPGVLEKLRELCRWRPGQEEGCAQSLRGMMEGVGLEKVRVGQGLRGVIDLDMNAPFVVGERAGPAGSPSVLIYASYAT